MIHTSDFWKRHFTENLSKQRIDWSIPPQITPAEKEAIIYSLKAWQLGETSDGKQLLKVAAKHAKRENDPQYFKAVQLFIKEEQKHGSNLGTYIDLIGEKPLKRDLGDTLFRKMRHLNSSMEAWTITVVIVESAAQLFYQALHDSTNCPLLQSICSDILIDEAHHIKFQNERLHIIFNRKRTYIKTLSVILYSILFFGTIHAVWIGHRKAFKAGGIGRSAFMQKMHYKFFNTIRYIYRTEKKHSIVLKPATGKN